MPTRTLLRTAAAAAAASVALLVALSACTARPSASSGEGSAPTTVSGLSGQAFDDAAHAYDLKLAQCFRDQGLDVDDPAPGSYLVADGPEFQDALPTCISLIGEPPLREITDAERQEALEKNLQMTACLREKGYTMQEPTLDEPGAVPAEVTDEDFTACRVD